MEQIQKFAGLGAIKWLKDIGPLDRWTRWLFDPQLSSDENTNNFVESFNSTIGADRSGPILTLLEGNHVYFVCYMHSLKISGVNTNTCVSHKCLGVRRVAMVRHATRQQLSEQWKEDGICPNIVAQVRVLTKDCRTCHAYPAGRGEYEVTDGKSRLPVSLNKRACVCGKWQICGIPCKHGIKAILHAGKEPLDFVSEWYSVARYKKTYSGNILPIPDFEQWPPMEVPRLIPPAMKRSIGRPSRNRRREEGEQKKGKRSTTVQCSKCKEYGHNAQTCKGGATKKEKLMQQEVCAPTKAPKKGKKRATSATRDGNNGNIVELMIAQSQASNNAAYVFQPSSRYQHNNLSHSSQPSTSAAVFSTEISPKRQRTINRLNMV